MDWVNTSPLVKTYTLEEFWELPDPPDYSKVELIAGILYLTPRPDLRHSNVVSRLVRIMMEHRLRTNDEGMLYVPRAGIRRKPNTWLEPDFFYVTVDTDANFDGEYHTTADMVV